MQNQNHHDIEKRMAIYQGNLEKQALYAGQSFSERRQTVVLFLCDHDVYNLNRVHYQLILQLVGYPEILIDNSGTNVIVNLKDDASKQAALNQEMLTYFNDGTVTGKFSVALDRAVREVKNDVKKGKITWQSKNMLPAKVLMPGKKNARKKKPKQLKA